MSAPVIALHWTILAVLSFCALTLIGNLIVFRGLRRANPPANAPLVSILVPARNEERNITACVESLLAQDYPNWELVVVDDHSSDATGDIVRGLFARHRGTRRLQLLQGESLPGDWVGKNWACHQLSQQARGDFLFFTDADTKHAPGTVAAAVAFAQKHRADLVSAWPQMITETLGEKLIIPIIIVVGFAMCPHWLAVLLQNCPALARRLPKSVLRAVGGANGQFMFFSRKGYTQIGGHTCVKNCVVEDVALGRAVAEQIGNGLRLFNCESLQFSTVRMYHSFGETWAGFTKNLRAIFEDREVAFWLFLLCMWGCFVVPCFRWVWANETFRPYALAELGLVVLIRFAVTWRFRLTWLGALLHPLGVALVIACSLQSWRLSHSGRIEWKAALTGRKYNRSKVGDTPFARRHARAYGSIVGKAMKTKTWVQTLGLGVVLLFFCGCTTVNETGRKQLSLVSAGEETKLGLTAWEEIKKQTPISRDAAGNAMVQRVGRRIASVVTNMPDAQWEFVLFEDKTPNAFCLPGGKVGVNTGILPLVKDDAGLATVIGHEVAHAALHHGGERMSQAMLEDIGGQVLGAATGTSKYAQAIALAYGVGAQVGYELPHSRQQESEADRVGLRYMARAGYNPEAALAFWQRFSAANEASGGSGPPAFLRTHPVDSKRINDIQSWLPEAKAQMRAAPRTR